MAIERDGGRREQPDGPRIGLGSYDARDPVGTFRPLEPYRPPPEPSRLRALAWPLRIMAVWLTNLAGLLAAGLLFTTVGPSDPFAYVTWAAFFGLLGLLARPAARVAQGRRTVLLAGAALLGLSLVGVWLMTVASPPFHGADLLSIARAALIMALVNAPLGLLVPPDRPRAR